MRLLGFIFLMMIMYGWGKSMQEAEDCGRDPVAQEVSQ